MDTFIVQFCETKIMKLTLMKVEKWTASGDSFEQKCDMCNEVNLV